MRKIQSFTDLESWRQAHSLLLEIYQLTRLFPKYEQFGLTSQIRRASISITSNIAEGFKRPTRRDKARFYWIANSSLSEVQNQLLIARDLSYITEKSFKNVAEKSTHVARLITGLTKSSFSKRIK